MINGITMHNKTQTIANKHKTLRATVMIALYSICSEIYEHEDTNFPSKWIWSNTGSPYINCTQEHKYAKQKKQRPRNIKNCMPLIQLHYIPFLQTSMKLMIPISRFCEIDQQLDHLTDTVIRSNNTENKTQSYQKLLATDMMALHSFSSDIYEHEDTNFTS